MTEGDVFAGRYRLVRRLGIGGFSVVWLAADQMADDMELALKIYAPERGMDEAGLKLFRKEYVLTVGMRHEGLLKAMHFDIHQGSPYLVMPFCERGSLAVRLLDDGPMDEVAAAEALVQMTSALAYLHTQNVFHGDIKPDNVLIDGNGRYLLGDFGISSKLRNTLRKSTDSVKSLTVAYSPPERFKGSGTTGPAGDVFALGVTLYEMMSGELPWGGIGGVYLTPDAELPVPPGSHSEELNQLVRSCLAYSAEARPTAAQLHAAAEHCTRTGRWNAPAPPPMEVGRRTERMPVVPPPPLASTIPQQQQPSSVGAATLPQQGFPPQTPTSIPTPAKGKGSNTAIWVVGGIVVLALAGAGAWGWMKSSETDPQDQLAAIADSIAAQMPVADPAAPAGTTIAAVDTVVPTPIQEPPLQQQQQVQQRQVQQQPVEEEEEVRLTGLLDADGDTYDYVGFARNGKPHGKGKATYRTGTVTYYDGTFRNGARHGRGDMKWDDGDRYNGDWKEGLRTGRGTYNWASGGKYTGDWVNAKMHGEGTYTWKDGDTYTGEWSENMMEGTGTFNVIDGNVTNCAECKKYIGQWADDKKVGQGRCFAADGRLLYDGSFSADAPTGTYPQTGRSRIEPLR